MTISNDELAKLIQAVFQQQPLIVKGRVTGIKGIGQDIVVHTTQGNYLAKNININSPQNNVNLVLGSNGKNLVWGEPSKSINITKQTRKSRPIIISENLYPFKRFYMYFTPEILTIVKDGDEFPKLIVEMGDYAFVIGGSNLKNKDRDFMVYVYNTNRNKVYLSLGNSFIDVIENLTFSTFLQNTLIQKSNSQSNWVLYHGNKYATPYLNPFKLRQVAAIFNPHIQFDSSINTSYFYRDIVNIGIGYKQLYINNSINPYEDIGDSNNFTKKYKYEFANSEYYKNIHYQKTYTNISNFDNVSPIVIGNTELIGDLTGVTPSSTQNRNLDYTFTLDKEEIAIKVYNYLLSDFSVENEGLFKISQTGTIQFEYNINSSTSGVYPTSISAIYSDDMNLSINTNREETMILSMALPDKTISINNTYTKTTNASISGSAVFLNEGYVDDSDGVYWDSQGTIEEGIKLAFRLKYDETCQITEIHSYNEIYYELLYIFTSNLYITLKYERIGTITINKTSSIIPIYSTTLNNNTEYIRFGVDWDQEDDVSPIISTVSIGNIRSAIYDYDTYTLLGGYSTYGAGGTSWQAPFYDINTLQLTTTPSINKGYLQNDITKIIAGIFQAPYNNQTNPDNTIPLGYNQYTRDTNTIGFEMTEVKLGDETLDLTNDFFFMFLQNIEGFTGGSLTLNFSPPIGDLRLGHQKQPQSSFLKGYSEDWFISNQEPILLGSTQLEGVGYGTISNINSSVIVGVNGIESYNITSITLNITEIKNDDFIFLISGYKRWYESTNSSSSFSCVFTPNKCFNMLRYLFEKRVSAINHEYFYNVNSIIYEDTPTILCSDLPIQDSNNSVEDNKVDIYQYDSTAKNFVRKPNKKGNIKERSYNSSSKSDLVLYNDKS